LISYNCLIITGCKKSFGYFKAVIPVYFNIIFIGKRMIRFVQLTKPSLKRVYYLFLLLSLDAVAQSGNDSIKSVTVNTKTIQHIKIPRTGYFIIPPPGFRLSTSSFGVEFDNKTFIDIMPEQLNNYYTMAGIMREQGWRGNS
jgi:hypothetical protein